MSTPNPWSSAPHTAESQKQSVWDQLVEAAKNHSLAVAAALETPTDSKERDILVDRVLRYGTMLDRWLISARMHGWLPEEIATVPGLHHTYVEELLDSVANPVPRL
jgi:hypothetical protein